MPLDGASHMPSSSVFFSQRESLFFGSAYRIPQGHVSNIVRCRYCAIDLCCFIVWIAFSRLARAAKYRGYDQVEILAGLLQGRVELSAAARMCDCVVIIFLLVALVAMGNGIILSRTGSDGEHSRLIKRAADIVSVFIGLIAAAQWGLRIRVYLEYYFEQYDINNGSEYLIGLMNIARQLDFAITLITLMSALAIMWRSVSIYLPTRAGKGIHWVCYLVQCSHQDGP